MRSRLLILTCLSVYNLHAQSKLTIGQYSYLHAHESFYSSPVVQYQSSHNWYAEARYNYEAQQTFSLYAGRSFSGTHAITWSVTPMVGVMAGKLRGGAAALNAELDIKKFYCSTQSQYCMSSQSAAKDFFFSWSEAGYRPLNWLYAGVSCQYTRPYHAQALPEPGFFACFSTGQWSFPVYAFLPTDRSAYFVAGIIHEWKYPKNGRIQTGKPSFPKKGRSPAY
jgi:hypothetical protein